MSLSSMASPGASRPSVSAIIIVFNGARYLGEAIESILGQTFADWELIVADDGSSDDSAAIAQEYSHAYPNKIRVIAHPDGANHGMAATRNLGITHARTSWKSKLLYWSEILRRLLRMVEHLSGTPGPPQRTKPTSFTRWAWRRTQLMNHPHYSSFFLIIRCNHLRHVTR
jgi:hypothetical protein